MLTGCCRKSGRDDDTKSQMIPFQPEGKSNAIYLIKVSSAAGVHTTKVLVQY